MSINRKLVICFLNYDLMLSCSQPVSESFWRMFGHQLPPIVKMYLRNGELYEGTCSRRERKMNGISDIILTYGLNQSQKMLFTYFGKENFFVTIFDSSGVETLLLQVSTCGLD